MHANFQTWVLQATWCNCKRTTNISCMACWQIVVYLNLTRTNWADRVYRELITFLYFPKCWITYHWFFWIHIFSQIDTKTISKGLFVSRVGLLLCLTNRIRICRVPLVTNETRGHWNGLCSLWPRPRTPSTLRGCIRGFSPYQKVLDLSICTPTWPWMLNPCY
jgi:hypothetical protein